MNITVTHWVAKDTLSIYSVEKPGFKQLLNTLDPRYDIPSRSHFSRTALPNLCLYPRSSETRDWSSKVLFCNYWHVIQCWYEAVYELHYWWRVGAKEQVFANTVSAWWPHWGISCRSHGSNIGGIGIEQVWPGCLTTDSGANIVNAASHQVGPDYHALVTICT